MTKIEITPKYSEVKPQGFYVYIHYRKSDGKPFYVGKGRNTRGFSAASRSMWWKYVSAKHGVRVEIAQDDMREYDAFTLESWLISKLRHEGYELVNLTDGGEGCSGFISNRRKVVYCSNGMSFDHTQDAADWLISLGNAKATSKIVCAAAAGKKKSIYGHAFSYDFFPPVPELTGKDAQAYAAASHGKKKVYCSHGGEYDSGSDAAMSVFGSHGHASKILACCRGERKSAYGRTWSFSRDDIRDYEDPHELSTKAKWKRIGCENGMTFDAIFLARDWLEDVTGRTYTVGAIQQSMKRGGKCGGYKFFRIDKAKVMRKTSRTSMEAK